MSHQNIQKWANHEVFEEYDHTINLQAIQQEGSFIPCCRPECERGQFHGVDADYPIIAPCQACGAMSCYRHFGLPWHEGFACDEFEDPDMVIRLLQELICDLELASRAAETTLPKGQSQVPSEDTECILNLALHENLFQKDRPFLLQSLAAGEQKSIKKGCGRDDENLPALSFTG